MAQHFVLVHIPLLKYARNRVLGDGVGNFLRYSVMLGRIKRFAFRWKRFYSVFIEYIIQLLVNQFHPIEQSLSTFSSHMGQIAGILRNAANESLVLLDELGAGTEPAEGAALGAAVLESLIERGCVTIVTTHHNALKLFGSQTDGAKNSSMEFDPQTLKPTYRFLSGRPGRSYGLDMATRLGVPDETITRARARLGQDDKRLENLLEQM